MMTVIKAAVVMLLSSLPPVLQDTAAAIVRRCWRGFAHA
jgi:hypothetical protein